LYSSEEEKGGSELLSPNSSRPFSSQLPKCNHEAAVLFVNHNVDEV
jgi:hypothetical protein